MAKDTTGQFETVVKRLLSTPPKPHTDSKIGKAKPGAVKGKARLAKAGRDKSR